MSKLQIAVLDRGFVYVGKVSVDGDFIQIDEAQNIRRWGTERGLGQLASEGPQPNTKLDPTPPVTAPMRALVHLIDCEPTKWAA
jgi:hypothetical protein